MPLTPPDFPMPIVTPRLILRPPHFTDAKEFYNAVRDSFKELHQWMPWARTMPAIESIENFILQSNLSWICKDPVKLNDERFHLPVFLYDRKNPKKLIGGSGFQVIHWNVPELELGYWQKTSESGKGYMTEAVNALTRYALEVLKMKKVEIHCDTRNIHSWKIPERLNFQRSEIVVEEDQVAADGSKIDVWHYKKYNTESIPPLEVKWGPEALP
jgi:ribosomal-protein-serine acetyltransferase